MKKTLLLLTTFVIIFCWQSKAQLRLQTKAIPTKRINLQQNQHTGFGSQNTNAACDTLNLLAANNWSQYYYEDPNGGYTFGVGKNSGFSITEDANVFTASGANSNYISGASVYFAYANSNKSEDLNKDLILKVYDDNSGYPGNLLGSTSIKLSQAHQDVLNDALTTFKFATPIAVPASKVFYISIDHSNFSWGSGTRDSIAIIANADDETAGAAYQLFLDNSSSHWQAVNETYAGNNGGLDVSLFIFPYLSNTPDGCGIVLPVSILNFGGFIKDNAAYLNWSTAMENNNKGFYIERSKDAQNFSNIGFVAGAGNSSQIRRYAFQDISVKDMLATTTYYRLKQMDLDGKFSYSKVLALNLKNVAQWRLFPNPVKDMATVELNLTTSSAVTVMVFAQDGRVVANTDKGILTAGTQQVFINMQSLAKGAYTVRVKAGSDTYSKIIVKE
ncbi:MAG: T9SS type A sorting domain-containing protein [Bacteroidetes bacterium]|nr:T9SS type A sorting domain-containing protein [Bacteroidota bacterium]